MNYTNIMDKQKIYQKIHDIALQLQREDSIYTRADLAYDLQDLGVSKDTVEVGMLVWEAYQHFHNDNAIKSFFYDNDKKESLVTEFQVDHLLDENDSEALFPLLQGKLKDGSRAIDKVNDAITKTMNGAVGQAGRDLLSTVTGTQGVVQVKSEATAVFEGYSRLVGNYNDAKFSIKHLITDFTKLRGYVCDIYQQYALVLTDAFGDSIKAVAPELFNFESIEWLDVQGMLQNVKLDYDKVTERCSLLMSDISDSFANSVKQASLSYKSTGDKRLGLAMAGFKMISHYVNAGQKTAELKQELLSLKNSVKHDATLIRGDLSRLAVIYKSLNDLYIPKSEAFCRFSQQVLTTEWQQLENALYENAEVRQLKQHRDELLAESKDLDREMTDAEMNINFYTTHINECQQLLDSMRPQYEQAMRTKPSKPFFLVNLFTFGSANKTYNRDIYEWNQACKPVITQFEGLQVDVKMDQDELNMHQAELTKNKKRAQELKRELQQQNRKIMESIRVSQDTRIKMLPHLEAMIKLLRLAREIANSKLDQQLTRTVSITRLDTTLPPEIQQNISAFADMIRGHVQSSTLELQNSLQSEEEKNLSSGCADQPSTSPDTPTEAGQRPTVISKEDISNLTDAEGEAIQNTINLLETWGHLEAMKAQSAIAHQTYDKELEKLQSAFQKNLADIDNKSAILRKSLQQINTAQNHEQLKEGLLSLAGKDSEVFTEKDWDEFLNGNKTIEL